MKVFIVTKDYQNLGTYEDRVCRYNEFVGLFKDLESAKKSIESDIDEDFEIPKYNDDRLENFYMYDECYANNYDKNVIYHMYYTNYDDKDFSFNNYLYLYEVKEYEI